MSPEQQKEFEGYVDKMVDGMNKTILAEDEMFKA